MFHIKWICLAGWRKLYRGSTFYFLWSLLNYDNLKIYLLWPKERKSHKIKAHFKICNKSVSRHWGLRKDICVHEAARASKIRGQVTGERPCKSLTAIWETQWCHYKSKTDGRDKWGNVVTCRAGFLDSTALWPWQFNLIVSFSGPLVMKVYLLVDHFMGFC